MERILVATDLSERALRALRRGLTNVLLIEKGGPFEAIKSAVKKVQADLLVIGTRGHGGLKRALLGSVADQALRQIECDILAVPPERSSITS